MLLTLGLKRIKSRFPYGIPHSKQDKKNQHGYTSPCLEEKSSFQTRTSSASEKRPSAKKLESKYVHVVLIVAIVLSKDVTKKIEKMDD
jgi:hypothetical protein